jgi:hypothetical protein
LEGDVHALAFVPAAELERLGLGQYANQSRPQQPTQSTSSSSGFHGNSGRLIAPQPPTLRASDNSGKINGGVILEGDLDALAFVSAADLQRLGLSQYANQSRSSGNNNASRTINQN